MRKILTCAWCVCAVLYAQAQKGATQLKQVTAADFKVSSPVVDTNANAVILADIGSTEFEGNNSGFFTIIFKQRKRILLRNRNSFDEATVKIPIYKGRTFDTEEKFEDFEATTYNLEGGQVVATKLDKASLFNEKASREYGVRKFTFPNIKEGSIIEYQYTVKSPFQYFNVRPWTFQHMHPVLWSEYNVVIPYMFKYMVSRKGYLPYTIDTAWKTFKTYTVIESGGTGSNSVISLSGDAINEKWVISDVPAFKPESYTSSSINHRNAIDFQLMSIKYSETSEQQMLKDWYTTTRELMKDADFGLPLSEDNNWINDAMKNVVNSTDATQNAKRIYAWVRDNIKCNDHDAHWLSQPLRKTFQTKTGNVCDVNMLLTAIYLKMGFEAAPVLLSTKEHGYPKEMTAILSQFNYVITRLKTDDSTYVLLDASQDNIGFGRLPEECYNISGRLVDVSFPKLIPLASDSLVESRVTNTIIYNDEKAGLVGGVNTNLGDIESARLRERLKGKKNDEYLKELKKTVSEGVEISNLQVDSLAVLDDPLVVSYDLKFKWNDEDVIYFNPMIGNEWNKNPFVSAQRSYPVEMPYRINETYVLNMEIPKGYKVDELPKSTRAALNNNEGSFEYLFAVSGGKLQFRTRLQLNKATFSPEDYETLRDFFALVVKKQQEQVVFKKGKSN